MVGQVKIVGILMLVNGITVTLMGILYAAMGSMVMVMMPPPPAGGGGPPPELFLIIYAVIGGITALCGLANIIAGIQVMRMRSRVFALIALFMNVGPLITCYCAPTCIAMMVYGLIVLFQRDVANAFEFVRRGGTPDEAVQKFGPRRDDIDDIPGRDDVEDDYDDHRGNTRRGWDEDRRRRREGDDPEPGDDRVEPRA